MAKDYYDVLGVSKTSTAEEIKQAYRKLARSHHPDMVDQKDKKQAEERFKEINEAYQVLSDSQKRKMYDTYGHTGFNGAGTGAGGRGGANQGQWGPFTYTYTSGAGGMGGGNPFEGDFEGFDPFDVFESIFGSRGFGGSRAPKRGKNLYYELHVDFKDAVFGLEKEINAESGKVSIKIPKGIYDGAELKFAGKGMPGPNNTPAGDLFITVRYRSPREFEVVRENIVVAKTIDFVTATLGGDIEIPIIDLSSASGIGTTRLRIPSGTQYGTRFLVKGKGMPRLNYSGQGDVLVQVAIETPKKISKKQKQLLEDYLKS